MMSLFAEITYLIIDYLIWRPLGIVLSASQTLYYWRREHDMLPTKGKAILITGCDSGFGNGVAKLCASRGATVFAGCLTDEGVDAMNLCTGIRALKYDITSAQDTDDVLTIIKTCCEKEQLVLWGVLCNAGIPQMATPADWMTTTEYARLIHVNTIGHIRTALAFLPAIKTSKGRLVFMTAATALVCPQKMSGYSSSKHGIEAFARCLRHDLARTGVHVSTITPGFFNTDVWKNSFGIEERWDGLTDELKEEYPKNEYLRALDIVKKAVYRMAEVNKLSDVYDACYHSIFGKIPRLIYSPGKYQSLIIPTASMPDEMQSQISQHPIATLQYHPDLWGRLEPED